MKHPRTRTRLYSGSALALVCAALIGLGACSSTDGKSKAEEEDLEKQVEEALQKQKEAEDARDEAEEAKDVAEAAAADAA